MTSVQNWVVNIRQDFPDMFAAGGRWFCFCDLTSSHCSYTLSLSIQSGPFSFFWVECKCCMMLSHLSDHRHSIQGEIHTCQLAYMTPFFFFFFGHIRCIWSSPGEGWNTNCSWDLCHSCEDNGSLTHPTGLRNNAGFLTCCTSGELPQDALLELCTTSIDIWRRFYHPRRKGP